MNNDGGTFAPDPWFGLSRRKRTSKHRRTIFVVTGSGKDERRRVLAEFSATKTPPWKVRARNRAANKRARASRKVNR